MASMRTVWIIAIIPASGPSRSSVWPTDAGGTGSGASRRRCRISARLRELLAWIREHEGATDPRIIDWLCRIEAEIDSGGFPRPGINVLAFFCYPHGLQESASCYVRCFQLAGVSTSCRDVPSILSSENKKRDESPWPGDVRHDLDPCPARIVFLGRL